MLTELQRRELDWEKTDGLMPVIVQHAVSGEVLMLGYMNPEALDKTIESGKVTFFSRTKQRLWTKGETSGNFLNVVSIAPDCDNDTLLVLANPIGPTCHKGTSSCFGDTAHQWLFLYQLEQLLAPATKAPAAASATPLTSGCSCINWNNCSPNANLPTRKPLTLPNCMPAAPNALRRKWVKKAWKPHWQQRCMTALSSPTKHLT